MHRTQSGFARLCALASLRHAVLSYRSALGLLLQLLLGVAANQGGRFDRGTVGIVMGLGLLQTGFVLHPLGKIIGVLIAGCWVLC